MTDRPSPSPNGHHAGRLIQPPAAEQREALTRWRRLGSGMDGERITHLNRPDDPVAYRLLDAAGLAFERGDSQAGLNILRLVVRDYRHSQEAALARQAIGQLKRQASHGR